MSVLLLRFGSKLDVHVKPGACCSNFGRPQEQEQSSALTLAGAAQSPAA